MDWKDKKIAKQAERIKELEALLAKCNQRISELERRLNLNSSNSGKPPSSDGLKKPSRVKSLREKSDKNSGGQPGHRGTTLKQVENPDTIEYHQVSHCPDCNTDLMAVPVANICKRQVFDIPKITKQVTEYQFEVKHCPTCDKKIKAAQSKCVKAPVQYGDNAKALVLYLNSHQLIPEDRVAQTMSDIFRLPMAVATIENINKFSAEQSADTVAKIEASLKKSPVKGADESGLRVEGKTRWLHTLCNDLMVHYRATEKRGDVPTDVVGIVTHDHFVSYYSKLNDDQHSLCNAHHLRELKALIEIEKEAWARNMKRVLLLGFHYTQRNNQRATTKWLTKFKNLYNRVIAQGLFYHDNLGPLNKPKRGRVKRRPGHNLLLRLQKRANDVLRFLDDPQIPFTNNQSEQALRMIKVKQKISGGFRTFDGAHRFLTIRSYTATAQKQGFNVLDALKSVVLGMPLKLA